MKVRDLFPKHVWHNRYFGVRWQQYHLTFADEFTINEGLYKSLPIDDLEAKLRALFNLSLYSLDDYPGNLIIEFLDKLPSQKLFSKIEQVLKISGWFISNIVLDDQYTYYSYEELLNKHFERMDVVLEPYHSHPKIKTPKKLYHLTPLNVWENKISKIGLSPKSNSTRALHPERVYFITKPYQAYFLVNQLYSDKYYNANPKLDKWALLEIDTSKIKNLGKHSYFQVFTDTKFFDGKENSAVYSLNSIPPNAISLLRIYEIDS